MWASIPHLHKDLLKKLPRASGLHAWGAFLKTYRVYQGFLYIECQNTISYIECIMSYQTYFLYTINKSDATIIWWRVTVDMLSFLGWNECRMSYYNGVVVCMEYGIYKKSVMRQNGSEQSYKSHINNWLFQHPPFTSTILNHCSGTWQFIGKGTSYL